MSTLRQKALAKAIVENARGDKKKTKAELIVSSGYTKTSAEASPGIIIGQKGVQEELEKLGFDEESAKKVVHKIMVDGRVDPAARLKATDQVFKVLGSYAPEKKILTGEGGKDLFPVDKIEVENYAKWRIQQGLSLPTIEASAETAPLRLDGGQSDEDKQGDTV